MTVPRSQPELLVPALLLVLAHETRRPILALEPSSVPLEQVAELQVAVPVQEELAVWGPAVAAVVRPAAEQGLASVVLER